MMNLDQYVLEFIQNNWLTLTMAIGVLKLIAKATPWAVDDQIMQIISGAFTNIKRKPFPVLQNPTTNPVSERGETPENTTK